MTSFESAAAASPRPSKWEWAQTALLAANLTWTTLCLGGYRPETMIITASLTAVLLAVHLFARALTGPAERTRTHPAGWLLLPFVAYAAANAAWMTPVPWLGWRDWFGWAELVAIFWVVLNGVRSAAARQTLFATLVALGIAGVLLGCFQRFVRPDWLMLHRLQADQFVGRASGSFGIPNSFAAFLLLLVPAVGALTFRRGAIATARVLWGWIALVLVLGLGLTISRGAWLGLALALVVWPLAVVHGGWRRRLGIAFAVVTGVVAVVAILNSASLRVHARLIALVHDVGEKGRPTMWRAAWKLFEEHPAVGTGAGSYNVLFEKYRPEAFLGEPQWAHNDYLNTLSDYGAVGFGLLFGAWLVMAVRSLGQRPLAATRPGANWLDAPEAMAGLMVGVLAFALQLFVDFHFKIPALAMAWSVLTALIVQRRWPAMPANGVRRAMRFASVTVALAGLAGTMFVVVPRFRGEAYRYRAREAIDGLPLEPDAAMYRRTIEPARSDLARAVALDSDNAQAWSDIAYAASLWAHVEPVRVAELGIEAERAADRALAVTSVCGEFWIRRGTGRDMQGRWPDGGFDINHAVTLWPNNPLAWYYYAYHLSLNRSSRPLAEAAIQFCLRLDAGNAPALALRQRLAISPKSP